MGGKISSLELPAVVSTITTAPRGCVPKEPPLPTKVLFSEDVIDTSRLAVVLKQVVGRWRRVHSEMNDLQQRCQALECHVGMGVSQAQLVPRKQLDDLLNDVVFTIGTSALKRELRQSRELYVKDRDSFVLKVESAELASGIESLREGVLFELERLGQVVGRVRHVTANESYLWSGKRVEESLFGVSDSIAAAFANFKGNQESEVMALNERLVDLREQVTQRKRRVLAQLEFLERIDIEAGDQVSLQRALDGARRCRVAAPYVAEGKKESRSVV